MLTKVSKLREEYNSKDASQERKYDILNEIYLYKDVLDAESALNEIYTRMENEDEYEVNIEKIDFNKFLDNLTKMDTPYNVETLDSLDFMLNH